MTCEQFKVRKQIKFVFQRKSIFLNKFYFLVISYRIGQPSPIGDVNKNSYSILSVQLSLFGIAAVKSKFLFAFLALFFCRPEVVESGISVIGGLTHEREAILGEIYQGVIIVKNATDEPVEVKMYQTDYRFYHDGRNYYDEPGINERSNANWISFSPQRLLIHPKGNIAVSYKVEVPQADSLVGTYWSMIMVEEIPGDSPEASKPRNGQLQTTVRQVLRMGIQMVTHIGSSGHRELNFLDTALLKDQSKMTLQVDVENVGERWLRPYLWAELYDRQGRFIGRFEGNRLRIYPGTSVRFRIDLSQLPQGIYKALVVADSGGDDIFGINYNLQI